MAEVLARFSPRYQARAFTAGTTRVDDRVFMALERAGYVDLFRFFRLLRC